MKVEEVITITKEEKEKLDTFAELFDLASSCHPSNPCDECPIRKLCDGNLRSFCSDWKGIIQVIESIFDVRIVVKEE